MKTLHSALMQMTVLSKCGKTEFFVIKDDKEPGGSKFLSRKDYARTMLGFASYIADNCPQLFEAIPMYLKYLSEPVTSESVTELIGASFSVITSEGTFEEDKSLWCRQIINISEDMMVKLDYSFITHLTAKVYYKGKIQETTEVTSMGALCDLVYRYKGEVVEVEN